jgi:hypothetical protein
VGQAGHVHQILVEQEVVSGAGIVQRRLPEAGMETEAGHEQRMLGSGKHELQVQHELEVQHGLDVQDEHGMIQMTEPDHPQSC